MLKTPCISIATSLQSNNQFSFQLLFSLQSETKRNQFIVAVSKKSLRFQKILKTCIFITSPQCSGSWCWYSQSPIQCIGNTPQLLQCPKYVLLHSMWKHTICRVCCGALWYDVVEAYADTGHHSSPAAPQYLLIASLTTPPHPLRPRPIWLVTSVSQHWKIAKKSKDTRYENICMYQRQCKILKDFKMLSYIKPQTIYSTFVATKAATHVRVHS